MPFCHNCGAQLPEGSKFCPSCGTPIVTNSGATPPPPQNDAGGYTEPASKGPEPAASAGGYTEPAPKGPEPAAPAGGYTSPSGYTAPGGGYTNPAGGGGYSGGSYPPPQKPAKQPMDKKMLGILIGAGALVLVLVIVLIVVLVGRGKDKTPDFDTVKNEIIQEQQEQQSQEQEPQQDADAGIGGAAVTEPGSAQQDASSYSSYTNSNVKFSVEYPDGCTVSEPYENGTIFADGDGFQLAVEYAYVTPAGDAFIYDAADFNDLFQSNNALVTDWIGTTDVTLRDQGQLSNDDDDGYYYDLETQVNGETHSIGLFILDGHGDFGVYSIMVMINEDSAKADQYYEWLQHFMSTFSIDGAYQPSGYTVHEAYDVDADFIVSDSTFAKEEDETATVYQFYPVAKVYTQARVVINDTAYEASKDVQSVMEGVTGYYAKKSNAQYTSQLSQFHRGRYDYYTIDLTYEDEGETYGVTAVIFQDGGKWWQVYGVFTPQYKDTTMSALNEVLMSLKP